MLGPEQGVDAVVTQPNATALVREALAASGVELIASCSVRAYDAVAPDAFRSSAWLPGAQGLVVAGSAGPALWRRFRQDTDANPERWDDPHPLDRFVRATLDRADRLLERRGVRFRRFEAAFHATPRVDFVAMARLVGLGSPGPFGLMIHHEDGPWWALRGAWLVDAVVDPPLEHPPPCAGCAAPCVGGWSNAAGSSATVEARSRCVVGQEARYDDDQIAYHYDRAATVARLRAR